MNLGRRIFFILSRDKVYSRSRFYVDLAKITNARKIKIRKNEGRTMRVLNVAEKNDAAKNIAALLSRGNSTRREGFSVYNKIYEFDTRLFDKDCKMIMTSVSGHLLNYEFVGAYRKWQGCHPLALFDAPVAKQCQEETFVKIKRTLEREIKSCGALIVWTDCDREGENIGFEVIDVCTAVKPSVRVYRAKFSEITQASVRRAIENLGEPNKPVSDAVDVRSELDLRIGAAFTRFQTLRLQKVFPRTLADMLISYGSCQFPTLGFVVERFLAIERFQSEPYWRIKVTDARDEINVEFRWSRNRLFEELPCQVLLDVCQERGTAVVETVTGKPKSKWRPLPLDTVELEKQGSRKLRLNAKETMKIAEKLYTQGLISYPRTETNVFPKELNLRPLVEQQTGHEAWGDFARRVLEEGVTPRQGKKSDQAHPPIHPTKFAQGLQGNEGRVYEFVVRHFLACVSRNAEGHETTVEIDIAAEKFVASGLQILAKNYLDVYIYEKWSAKEIHRYAQGQVFTPTSIEIVRENTSPPNLLTEADLIALMDKHGIGTDATHAEHIDTIKAREYVGLRDGTHFVPGKLGIGLVMGYDSMGFPMSKPNLRAELENDLKAICEGRKNPREVAQSQINKYRDVFKIALERANMIDTALARYIDEEPTGAQELENVIPPEDPTVFKCPRCGSNMVLRDRRQGTGKYIGCANYPTCSNAIWLPQDVTGVEVLEDICPRCPGDVRKLRVKMKPGSFPVLGTCYTACIGGCDRNFNEMMNIHDESIRRANGDSGYYGTTSGGGSLTSSARSGRGGGATQPETRNRTVNSGRGGGRGTSGSRARLDGPQRPQEPPRPRGPSRPRGGGGGAGGGQPTSGSVAGLTGSSENSTPWGSIREDSAILCDCHERANQLTVSKEGPNKGRKFYKCAKPRDSQCNFFMWAEDDADGHTAPENNPRVGQSYATQNSSVDRGPPARPSTGNGPPSAAAPTCTCGQPTVQRTVRKEGPNTGRKFWACPQGPGSSCNFFSWADETAETENDGGGTGGNDWETRGGWGEASRSTNRGRGANRRGGGGGGRARGPTRGSATGQKRKCGNCGVEGHTKRTCPQNSMD